MEIVGLRGERVRLVRLDRTLHFENAFRWINDPDATAHLKDNFGASRAQEAAFFQRIESESNSDLVWGIHDETDRHIGLIGLHGIHWRLRHARGGLVIGDREAWGKGYATEAVRVRTRFGFNQMGLHRIDGHTFNPAMKRVYEKSGYTLEGIARKLFWRDGRWHDAWLFSILEEDLVK